MKAVVRGGFLVAVEGVDGGGKTTVAALLAQYCGERGLLCTFSHEPTGLVNGRRLRESAKAGRLSPQDELDLFLKDRADHAGRAIRPTLAAGGAVILDRYYWSNAAYQGARGIDPFQILADNEAFAPKPDLVILLDVPPRSGLGRVRGRGDAPDEFERINALDRARDIFLELHERSGGTSVCIDASAPLRDVHAAALRHFRVAAEALIRERETDPGVIAGALAVLDA
jgi:dTMP kinase